MSLYRFIDAQKADFRISDLCRVLEVPPSSYFDWNSHGRQLAVERAAREQLVVAKNRPRAPRPS